MTEFQGWIAISGIHLLILIKVLEAHMEWKIAKMKYEKRNET